jgi:hypothetical protein
MAWVPYGEWMADNGAWQIIFSRHGYLPSTRTSTTNPRCLARLLPSGPWNSLFALPERSRYLSSCLLRFWLRHSPGNPPNWQAKELNDICLESLSANQNCGQMLKDLLALSSITFICINWASICGNCPISCFRLSRLNASVMQCARRHPAISWTDYCFWCVWHSFPCIRFSSFSFYGSHIW